MKRTLLAVLALLLVPASAFAARPAASFSAARSLLVASSSPGNAYLAGMSVVSTAPVAGDLLAVGGSVVVAAPVKGDELLFTGSASVRASVAGDLRVVGGNIDIAEPVAGDLVAVGYDVDDAGRAGGNVFIVAVNTVMENGADGPVTVYGNNVSLAGDFAGNVTIVAGGHVTLAEHTVIHGTLSYQAPEPAAIPASAAINGGVEYTNASYLPDAGTSRILAFVSMGFFLFARILGALILAGLLTGLFPRLAEAVVLRAYTKPRDILLTMLLGFAILVATPVLLLLLSLTFVGIGLAILLFLLYALMVLLALLYSGVLLGSIFVRRFASRETLRWHDGVFGMLAFSLIALVPVIGPAITVLLAVFVSGALLQLFFYFAFPHEEHTPEML